MMRSQRKTAAKPKVAAGRVAAARESARHDYDSLTLEEAILLRDTYKRHLDGQALAP